MTAHAPESAPAVGPYRLIGQIGEGGMGVVYLAIAPDDTSVAVKVLRPYVVGDANGRDRIAREVASLRRVTSRRIAEVYDADPWGPTPYIVTRYVAGPSLRELVDTRGPLPAPALLRLGKGLADALAVVHAAGVLHRDVKPSNVLLENGEPVLIDFGLAQLADDMHLTQVGWVLGTPGYLAPEVLAGEDASPAADVHAWGATLVFAASGSGPYGSGPPLAILDRAHRGEPRLDAVPVELRGVVSAALRVDPDNRPTARQLVDMLGMVTVAPPARPLARQASAYAPSPPDDRTLVAPVGGGGPEITAAVPVASGPRGEPSRLRSSVFWLTLLCLVVCGTLAAPVIALIAVVVAQWALRTAGAAHRSHTGRLEARGPRRRDPALVTVLTPWFAALRLPAAVANACYVAAVAAGPVALARLGPASVETPSLAVAGLVVGLGSWLGPLGEEVRGAGRLVSGRLPRSGLGTVVLTLLLLGLATGLLALQQISGVAYWPL